MTPSKDTLELGNLSSEATEPQAASRLKSDASRLRSDAVSLEVPVKVHGSRVTEVVRGVTAHTEPFEEQASTMIVFPQGGVLKMTATMSAGQMVVITNLKSGQDAICRVGKVRPYGSAHSYVEIEFTQRQPGYWGVYFPSEGPELAKRVAPATAPPLAPVAAPLAPASPTAIAPATVEPVAASSLDQQSAANPAPDLSTPVAKSPDEATISSSASGSVGRRIQPSLPESRFVSIGSKEDVQPAASDTIVAKANPFARSERQTRATEAPRNAAAIDLPAPPAAPEPSISMADLQGETQVSPWRSAPTSETADTIQVSTRPAPQELFGVRLESASSQGAGNTAEGGRKWLLIVAIVAVVLGAVGGGAYYLRGRSAAQRATNSIPAAPAPTAEVNDRQNPVSQPVTSSGAVPAPVAQLSPANPTAAMVSERAIIVRESEAAPAKPAKASSIIVPSQPTAPAQQKTVRAMPNLSSALTAHPVSSRTTAAAQTDAAPALDVEAGPGSATAEIPGVGNTSVNLVAPAQPTPVAPLRVGGDVKPPRMISSTMPVYPMIARQAGVEGTVVIETVVDKSGNVTLMKTVSGPLMLRQPALDALRQWKYQPGTLNGEPVSVEIAVTIQFHR